MVQAVENKPTIAPFDHARRKILRSPPAASGAGGIRDGVPAQDRRRLQQPSRRLSPPFGRPSL